jgi:ferredoxin
MSVAINETCITCGACEWECPNQAISLGAIHPIVDQDLCTECYGFFGESQCVVVCPVKAIVVVNTEPSDKLLERFNRINPNREPQDTWAWRRIGSDS